MEEIVEKLRILTITLAVISIALVIYGYIFNIGSQSDLILLLVIAAITLYISSFKKEDF